MNEWGQFVPNRRPVGYRAIQARRKQMRLVKVEQSRASSTLFQTMGLGPWFLGWCVAPRSNPAHGFCGAWVTDDGTGYADLDGKPFEAYVCKACGDKLKGESK